MGGMGNPSDPIFRLMQKLMGDYAPTKSQVIVACDGLDGEDIESVRLTISQMYRSESKARSNAWRATERQLTIKQDMKRWS